MLASINNYLLAISKYSVSDALSFKIQYSYLLIWWPGLTQRT